MHIPIRLGLLGANGHDIGLKLDGGEDLTDGVVSLTKRKQRFRFVDVPSRPVPSLLRGFSAPVNVTLDLPDDDAELLMANDSDLFNRWQAANTYAARTLVEAVAGLTSGKKSNRGAALCARARRGAGGRRPRGGLPRRVAEAADAGRCRPHHRPQRRSGAGAPCPPRR